MLHLSIEASVAAALGVPKVLFEGSNLALCEVESGRIVGVVFGDSVVVVLIVVLGVLECRLAADDWVVLIWFVVVVKGMLVVVTVLLLNIVGRDTIVVAMSGRSRCLSTAVADDLLGAALFLCSGEINLLESGSAALDVAAGATSSDIHSNSETTKHLR